MKRKELIFKDVSELKDAELKSANGGSFKLAAIAVGLQLYMCYFLFELATNPQAHIDAFKEGWNAAG